MSEAIVEFRERVDYGWLIVRQTDRVLSALSQLDPHAARPGLRKTVTALLGLLVLSRPATALVDSLIERAWSMFRVIDENPREALKQVIAILSVLLNELHERGLLLRTERLPVGQAEV